MPASPPPPDRALTRAIFVMALAAFASGTSLRISDPLLPQVASDFHASLGEASAIVIAYAIPYGVTQAFAGLVGDRLGKCQAVAAACAASCVLVLLCAAAQSLPQLTLARLVSAPGAAMIVPLGMAYVGDVVPYAQRQTVLARFLAGQATGMIAGQVFGGIIGDYFGWRTVFMALAAVFAGAALALVTQLRSNPHTKPLVHPGGVRPKLIATYRTLLTAPWSRFLLIAVFVEAALFYGGLTYVAGDLHHRFDLSLSSVGLIVAMFGVGTVLYAFSLHRLMIFGERVFVLAGGGVVTIGFLALALSPVWQTAPIACGVLGFGYYMVHNTLQTHATQMLPEARGIAVAGFASFLFLGASAGVALGAPIVDRVGGVPLYLLLAALWPPAALWLSWQLARR